MKKKTISGRLRHRIRIERRTDTLSDYGEGKPNWAELFTAWAQIRDESQREYTAQLHVQDAKMTSVEIRNPQMIIKPKDRAVWLLPSGNRFFDIKAVLAGDNVGKEVTLACIEYPET
jgi:head-tail adaptor